MGTASSAFDLQPHAFCHQNVTEATAGKGNGGGHSTGQCEPVQHFGKAVKRFMSSSALKKPVSWAQQFCFLKTDASIIIASP